MPSDPRVLGRIIDELVPRIPQRSVHVYEESRIFARLELTEEDLSDLLYEVQNEGTCPELDLPNMFKEFIAEQHPETAAYGILRFVKRRQEMLAAA
ncbi:MAG: hypothetical protein A2172_02190 [Candidatus Woykebacteria bacterium RBG_13_40_15]|uniref:Uncharacterized protein n=1 Tax=Candidatus Woykebacteria bacterium RBG_13_40_15 TaxID=1802593 RepID=A0A1G1W745_9BACT|nr:MAG: hypothetical protein A2172_02190 [Candidatus Woykebacteria bacterium RBG_13_40_15]